MTNELVKNKMDELDDLFKLQFENNKKIENLMKNQYDIAYLIYQIAATLAQQHGKTIGGEINE